MRRWVEHTGEIELEIEADSEEAVYGEAVSALAELLGDEEGGDPGAPAVREVAVAASDRALLLAELLAELAFLAESEGFVPAGVERLEAAPGRLQASVRGHVGAPPHLVKAVTYHRLSFAPDGGRWRATVVLDV